MKDDVTKDLVDQPRQLHEEKKIAEEKNTNEKSK